MLTTASTLHLTIPTCRGTAQDDERYEVVPGSGFSVSRTALRSNKSDYYINDRKSNFTEVRFRKLKFRELHIGF